jgi:hypothetical protein
VPDAAAQVIENATDQPNSSSTPTGEAMKACVAANTAAGGHGDKPPSQQDRAHGQRNAGQSAQDDSTDDLKAVPRRNMNGDRTFHVYISRLF